MADKNEREYNQDKATTLEGYIKRLLSIPKARAVGKEALLLTPPFQTLVTFYGLDKVKELIEKNWDV